MTMMPQPEPRWPQTMTTNLVKFIQRCQMSLNVHLTLVFHVFIAVAILVMVCGRRGLWLSWHRPISNDLLVYTINHKDSLTTFDRITLLTTFWWNGWLTACFRFFLRLFSFKCTSQNHTHTFIIYTQYYRQQGSHETCKPSVINQIWHMVKLGTWTRWKHRVLDASATKMWPLTPKPNQFVFVPRCTNDKSMAKIHQQILEISWTYGRRLAKHI